MSPESRSKIIQNLGSYSSCLEGKIFHKAELMNLMRPVKKDIFKAKHSIHSGKKTFLFNESPRYRLSTL